MKKIMKNKNKFRVFVFNNYADWTKELSVMELVIAIIRSIEDACIRGSVKSSEN